MQQLNRRKELVAINIFLLVALFFFTRSNNILELFNINTYCFLATIFIIALLAYRIQNKAEASSNNYHEIETLMNNMSGGIVIYSLDNKLSILYANDGYYNLTGYSRKEVREKFNDSGLSFMGEEELLKQLRSLPQQITSGESLNLEFKLQRKDESFIWIRANCHRTINPLGTDTLSYLMMDITDSKMAEQELILEKERYHIATELTNDIIFEYDIAADTLDHTKKYQELFGRSPLIRNFSENLNNNTLISPNSLDALKSLSIDFTSGKPTMSAELKILDLNNQYTWCHINGKTLYDDFGKPIKVIGKIVNIDAQKKSLEELKNKACRDPLTGLYNKTVTKTMIDDLIHLKSPRNSHAFMIIDIDNFKAVNDNLGHLVGDEVLTNVTSQLNSLFGANDIVGRIGGDEFVVFMSNIDSTKSILMKANAISHVLRCNYTVQGRDYTISGSIGISVYPNDGSSYNELLETADNALYRIKKNGKNNFALASTLDQYTF